jgi:small-conductance mechanosensitive channel
MDRRFRLSAILQSATLAVVLFVPWLSAATAQISTAIVVSGDHTDKTANAVAVPLTAQLSEARQQLQQAIQARDGAGERSPGQLRHALLADKQRLLDWLVDLHREKAKRIEDLIALRNTPALPIDEDPLVRALPRTPPYSAVQVDALRDEIDGLREKLAAADASIRANQTEIQNLHDQLKSRATASRQANERMTGAGSEADAAKARDELDVLDLLKRANEVEIAVTTLDQERLNLQISSWRSRIEAMQAVVDRIQPDQQLSHDDLAIQRQRVRSEHEKLAAEMTLMVRQNAQHRADQERLDADSLAGRQGTLLDLSLKTDNVILKGLTHLQMLNGVSGDAWEKRYVVLSSPDSEQRRAALQALSELGRKLADLRSQSRQQQEALRTEIRIQRVRIDNLVEDRREQGREKEALNLLLRQASMNERVELAAARLERLLSRWLADFAIPGDQGIGGWAAWGRDRAMALLKGIWQQELFVAEDVSEIDGRQVSVKHGVTVGKSIGLIVVFIVGYWLLARISRLIQHQLVRRLKVSHQFASVVRRWSMIVLSLALVVLLLNLARIPLSVFAFLGGTLAIGVGFGAQTIIKNFISGLIVLFERKVRVGDVVELGGATGYVTAVDLRATTVRSFNGVEALIPNANFIENQVVNWTYSNRQVRRELPVDIAYGTDVRQAEALLLAAAAEHACVLKDPGAEVYFDAFGDSALKVVLVYWVEFDGAKGPRRVDSDLRHDIYQRFSTAGIAIPFPQREVQLTISQPVPVRTTQERSFETIYGT